MTRRQRPVRMIAGERVAMELHQVEHAAQKEPYLAEIEEASGKFRALANLVRLG